MPMSPKALDAFLAQPLDAVLSTVDGQGRPRSAPVWFEWHEGAAYVFTGRRSLKWRNLQERKHAALCVDRREPPYAAVVLDGPVEESDRDLYEAVMGMAVRYYGEQRGREYAEQYRNPRVAARTVLFRIVPRHIASWDYAAEEGEEG
jgi:PPOX class probable F420-dependent enzyme